MIILIQIIKWMPPYWGNISPPYTYPMWYEIWKTERKKFGKGWNRTQDDRIKNDFGTRFTIYATGLN